MHKADLPKPRQIAHPLTVNFQNGMRLVGYEVTEGAVPWSEQRGFRLTTFWQRGAATDPATLEAQAFHAFVHLYQNGVLAQSNGPLGNHLTASLWTPDFPVSLWAPDEIVESLHFLPIPDSATPGKAHFEAGLYRLEQDTAPRIGIVDGAGQVGATQVDFGGVMIDAGPPQAAVEDLCPLGVRFEETLELANGRMALSSVQPDQLDVSLVWRAVDRPRTEATVFVHLLNAAGEIIGQFDQPPGGVENPTSLWAPGEEVRNDFSLTLPTDDHATTLRVGLYEPVGGRQLPVTAPATSVQYTPEGTYIFWPVDPMEPGESCP
ncbi:MAG: hypothetical protein R2873_28835 [Caldilineaceae bacterium]